MTFPVTLENGQPATFEASAIDIAYQPGTPTGHRI
jgi:hypothetical protein